jgi:anti-anti-sigma factor
MEISEEQAGDVTIVYVKGRIDSTTATSIGDKLAGLIKSGRTRLVVDLNDVGYLTSAGFRALLLAAMLAEKASGTLSLRNLSAHLRKLFEVAGFTDLFDIN